METRKHISTMAILALLHVAATVPTPVIAQDASSSVTVPCTVEGYYLTDLMSRLEGFVGTVTVDLGDAVKAGDTLIELNAPEIKAGVRQKEKLVEKALADVEAFAAEISSVQARASSLEARRNLRNSELVRVRGLVNLGVVTRAKLDEATFALESVVAERDSMDADMKSAEAKLVASDAAVEVARADLDHTVAMAEYLTIKAPFDGVITARNVDPGAYVRPPSGNNAMPLIQIESIDRVRVVIMVPYSSASGIASGSSVVISGIRGQEEQKGKITRTGAGFEKGSRMMRAEVEFDNKPTKSGKRLLRSGDYGSATIQLN